MGEWKNNGRLLAGFMTIVLLTVITPMHALAEGMVSDGDVEENSIIDNEGMIIDEEEASVLYTEENIASGVDGDITWVINAEGKLTINGTGDYSAPPIDAFGNVNPNLWGNYVDSIVFAEVNVTEMTNASHIFSNCSKLINIEFGDFDTSNITNMERMFFCCSSLTELNVANFDTGNVTNMDSMFHGCSSLTELNVENFNTAKVTSMVDMFCACSSLTELDLSNFDTQNVTNMIGMFMNCNNLRNLNMSNFNTDNVIGMMDMFNSCSNLTNLNLRNFNTGNVINMSCMFLNCSSLTDIDISSFDTANVTDMHMMFQDCSSLQSLDLSNFYTHNVTDIGMGWMFWGCSSLAVLNLENFDTSNVNDMQEMFTDCNSLQILHTPKIMGEEPVALPAQYVDLSGNQTTELTPAFTNTVLTRIEEEEDWNAFQITVEPYETPVIGREASFKVILTNNTDRILTTEWIYNWYYREMMNSEAYPGVPFGQLFVEESDRGLNGTGLQGITFASKESRVFKVTGNIPETWSEKSGIMIVVGSYDEGNPFYKGYGQGEFQSVLNSLDDNVVSSDFNVIQNALAEEEIRSIDYILGDKQNIQQADQNKIFSSLKGSSKTLSFVFTDETGKEKYRWTFEGSDIQDPEMTVNFQIIVDANNQDVLMITPDNIEEVDLQFINEGVLPGRANIKVAVGNRFSAEKLYLYYYNPDSRAFELVDDNVVYDGVYASFYLDHCSNYILTSSKLKSSVSENPEKPEGAEESEDSEKPENSEEPKSPETGGSPESVESSNNESTYNKETNMQSILHIVVRGDTLSKIASMYHTTVRQLLLMNPQIKNPNRIYVGQSIIVEGNAQKTDGEEYYIIRKGDTLYRISRCYGIPLRTLINMNSRLAAQKYIYPGQKVIIKSK